MEIQPDIYEVAKRLWLEEIDGRIEHLKNDFKFWQAEYYDHGDDFARKMYHVSLDLFHDMEQVKRHIEKWDTVCDPRQVYEFPDGPET